jgi:hypothetical protein
MYIIYLFIYIKILFVYLFLRYGVKSLISTLLSVGLVVHWRYISNSLFCNGAYTNTEQVNSDHKSKDEKEEVENLNSSNKNHYSVRGCEACARLHAEQGGGDRTPASDKDDNKQHTTPPLLCCASCEHILYNQVPLLDTFRCTAEDDYLTSDLAEAPYYKWMFLIIHWKHCSVSS